jgi:hypothetical protein
MATHKTERLEAEGESARVQLQEGGERGYALDLEDGKNRDGHADAGGDPVDMRVAGPGKDEAAKGEDDAGGAGPKESSLGPHAGLVAAVRWRRMSRQPRHKEVTREQRGDSPAQVELVLPQIGDEAEADGDAGIPRTKRRRQCETGR